VRVLWEGFGEFIELLECFTLSHTFNLTKITLQIPILRIKIHFPLPAANLLQSPSSCANSSLLASHPLPHAHHLHPLLRLQNPHTHQPLFRFKLSNQFLKYNFDLQILREFQDKLGWRWGNYGFGYGLLQVVLGGEGGELDQGDCDLGGAGRQGYWVGVN
jgi:hypothetical protein